jgi:hypothetical protein
LSPTLPRPDILKAVVTHRANSLLDAPRFGKY